jgi:hypothetical protein
LDNLGASLRAGLLRISLRYRTSCEWFPFGSYESLAQLFYIKILFGDAFGPGYSGLAVARLLLRNEPSPAYPYRGNFMLNYVFCEVF